MLTVKLAAFIFLKTFKLFDDHWRSSTWPWQFKLFQNIFQSSNTASNIQQHRDTSGFLEVSGVVCTHFDSIKHAMDR